MEQVNQEDVLVADDGTIIENPSVETPPADNPETPPNDEPEIDLADEGGEDDPETPADTEAIQAGETDEEREAIRERRRQERHDKKAKARERENTLRSELASRDAVINEMRSQLDAIQRRNTSAEMAQLQTAKTQSVQAYNHFKEQVRLATEANDGTAMADAMEKMQLARRRYDEINNIEQAYQRQQNAPAPLDPRLKSHADAWMAKNRWYNPQGDDEDSEIMLTIDQRMAREGWDPKTPEYWEELTKRAQKRLPHHFKAQNRMSQNQNSSQNQQREKPKSVVGGSGRESAAAPGNSKGYKLSADRVQALKDAGMWNDPAQRAEAIKRYKKYDQDHKS